MIDCDGCGKKHRDKTKVIECRVRKAKREEKAALKAADDQRREDNLAAVPVADMIDRLRREGTPRAHVPKALRDTYPAHADTTGRDFDSVSLVQLEHPYPWPMNESVPSPVSMTVGEQLAYARVMKAFDAKLYDAYDRVGAFITAWEDFHAAPWREVSPWKTTSGTGAVWSGWPQSLQEWYDEHERIKDDEEAPEAD